nr:cytochrome c biogenesis FN [Acorus tatarinowii]
MEFSHYSLFTGLFLLAFTYNKKQPPAFGAILSFWCILLSFLGLTQRINFVPFVYQISGTWSNHEGSILSWCWIPSFYFFLLCYRARPHTLFGQRTLFSRRTLLSIIAMFFSIFLSASSDPFVRNFFVSTEPLAESNPVLQDPILAIHPPCIYLGDVASALGFGLCVSKMMNGILTSFSLCSKKESSENTVVTCEVMKEMRSVRIWILTCRCFLTVGISPGSWWAHHELGWGGWWFRDPVENASFMPWVLATACLHSVMLPKLNSWTLFLNILTFLSCVLGTFAIRSGLLAPVHSFATDETRGRLLWQFFILITGISIFLLSQTKKRKK